MNQQLFNSAVLEEWRHIDSENWQGMVCDLLSLFLVSATERGARLIDDGMRGDWVAVRNGAHSLKSSCGNVGAVLAKEQLNSIEIACVQGDLARARSLLSEFEPMLKESLGIIENYYAGLRQAA